MTAQHLPDATSERGVDRGVDAEVDAGYVLTCQSYPVSEKLTVDYDS